MEETLRKILEGQQQLFDGQKQLFEGQKQLFDGQKQLFEGQKQLFAEIKDLKTSQLAVEQQLIAFQQFALERFDRLEVKTNRIEQKADKSLLLIENEVRPAIQSLAENQATQQAQLDRIEKQVSNHDEMIFRLVK